MRRRNTQLGRIQYTNDEDFGNQQKIQYVYKIQNTNPRLFQETELIVPQMILIPNLKKEFWNNTQIKNKDLNEKLINIKQSDESALSFKREQIRYEKRNQEFEDHFKINGRIGPERKDQSKKDQGKKMDYKQYKNKIIPELPLKLWVVMEKSREQSNMNQKYTDSDIFAPIMRVINNNNNNNQFLQRHLWLDKLQRVLKHVE